MTLIFISYFMVRVACGEMGKGNKRFLLHRIRLFLKFSNRCFHLCIRPIFKGSHHVNPKSSVFRTVAPVGIPAFLPMGIDKINSSGCNMTHMQVMASQNVLTVPSPMGKAKPKIIKSQPRIAPGIIKKYQNNLLLNISFLLHFSAGSI